MIDRLARRLAVAAVTHEDHSIPLILHSAEQLGVDLMDLVRRACLLMSRGWNLHLDKDTLYRKVVGQGTSILAERTCVGTWVM